MQRPFPPKTARGTITFSAPPQVTLNERSERLGPGVRVHDSHNRLVFASTLQGQSHVVNYVRDASGTIREIWILTPTEIARPPSGTAQAEPERLKSEYLN